MLPCPPPVAEQTGPAKLGLDGLQFRGVAPLGGGGGGGGELASVAAALELRVTNVNGASTLSGPAPPAGGGAFEVYAYSSAFASADDGDDDEFPTRLAIDGIDLVGGDFDVDVVKVREAPNRLGAASILSFLMQNGRFTTYGGGGGGHPIMTRGPFFYKMKML